MLAVVKVPRTQNTEKADFKIEGLFPYWLLTLVKGVFEEKYVSINDDDEFINIDDCKEFQEIQSKMTIGDVIKADRVLRGITQKQLAEKLGISVQNMSHIEHNRRNVSKKMAQKLSNVFNMPIDNYLK